MDVLLHCTYFDVLVVNINTFTSGQNLGRAIKLHNFKISKLI